MSEVAAQVFGPRFETISRYVDLLATDGVEWGLIGPREVGRLWERHILNAAALSEIIPQGASVVDVGSGAGLPGIPLAVLRPDLTVFLLEPLLRRYTFLTQVVDKLGISDTTTAIRGRAEDHHKTYDVVTARAVAPLDRLVGWCVPLMATTGALIALKGRSAADEVLAARSVLKSEGLAAEVLSVRADPAAEATTAVRVRRRP